ncbi:ATP-binding protein [Methanothrix harundinacea]|jgi:CO dehydrogenase maturation factor|uniref:Putative carbon monoxide dehydrogenase maturation factor n=1 Tax=Methanothrix harundinacea (strain 6Ac) TaxID=1110509 RepID=G7WM25_METH6|nr:P-loop NTPase [Methanothrix harundinacea]AET64400.1 Putative carbon monoxide dehydrogenase maturation factor [Methanothrix harundinacea 6Ac]
MKVLVCGKGGSGKSTVAALLAKSMAKRGFNVLVVDSDESNYGLHRQLGMELPSTLMDHFGGKKEMMGKMRRSFAGGEEASLFDEKWTFASIPAEATTEKDGIRLLAIGKIHDFGEGCACPMGALSRKFLDNLAVGNKEMVIVDTEAGIEHFGRGIEAGCDAILAVLDPSYESLLLSKKIAEISKKINKPLYFVLNRVDEERKAAMLEFLEKERVAAAIPEKKEIFRAGLAGDEFDFAVAEVEGLADLLTG